jgi:hypothetical protein
MDSNNDIGTPQAAPQTGTTQILAAPITPPDPSALRVIAFITTMWEWLRGKKTYILAAITIGFAIADYFGHPVPGFVYAILGAGGLTTLRMSVSDLVKIAKGGAMLLLVCALCGCTTTQEARLVRIEGRLQSICTNASGQTVIILDTLNANLLQDAANTNVQHIAIAIGEAAAIAAIAP